MYENNILSIQNINKEIAPLKPNRNSKFKSTLTKTKIFDSNNFSWQKKKLTWQLAYKVCQLFSSYTEESNKEKWTNL